MRERLSFSYPPELKKKLQTLAQRDQRTMSSYIQKVLLEHLGKFKWKTTRRRTKKGGKV